MESPMTGGAGTALLRGRPALPKRFKSSYGPTKQAGKANPELPVRLAYSTLN